MGVYRLALIGRPWAKRGLSFLLRGHPIRDYVPNQDQEYLRKGLDLLPAGLELV